MARVAGLSGNSGAAGTVLGWRLWGSEPAFRAQAAGLLLKSPAPMRLFDRATDPSQFDLRPSSPGACSSGLRLEEVSGRRRHRRVRRHRGGRRPRPRSGALAAEDSGFDQILLQDVIEHLDDLYAVFARGSSRRAAGSPRPHTHAALLVSARVLGSDPPALPLRRRRKRARRARLRAYSAARFRVVHVKLDLWLPFRALGIGAIANRWPDIYEKYLAFRFPAMNIRAELEVLK